MKKFELWKIDEVCVVVVVLFVCSVGFKDFVVGKFNWNVYEGFDEKMFFFEEFCVKNVVEEKEI